MGTSSRFCLPWRAADVYARITTEPLDVAALIDQVSASEHGAVLLFLGTVRAENEGKGVTGIEYHAYIERAERVLAEILSTAAATAGDVCDVAAAHRIGALGAGDASVAIAVATPHRATAYDVSRHIIEQIKERLPVWKHETYADGGAEWLDGEIPLVNSHE